MCIIILWPGKRVTTKAALLRSNQSLGELRAITFPYINIHTLVISTNSWTGLNWHIEKFFSRARYISVNSLYTKGFGVYVIIRIQKFRNIKKKIKRCSFPVWLGEKIYKTFYTKMDIVFFFRSVSISYKNNLHWTTSLFRWVENGTL